MTDTTEAEKFNSEAVTEFFTWKALYFLAGRLECGTIKISKHIWRDQHIWSNKKKPPLYEMHKKHVNMFDVRNELGGKTIRWKIEKKIFKKDRTRPPDSG